ncbi:Mv-ORF101 peptide [Maruca vitrata nucleopolyhedrovirus]|uniref:Mv-ORF101 peptide n=1 Tax=Maruca vitrata nucleopolyhedrovirus TaxID=1307954 RepID=A1YRG3_9ABAC|nr:Mv-ORF101 peptide [Maruca vitrata nucleopolyhedrovirus]ABM05417.1 Mv-ORF101 peptide [Maruca vitrata nucleopolyhedrovirus]
MSDKTPTKKGASHSMTLRDRGVTKPPKKSEKLQQYKKAIAAEQTLHTTSNVSLQKFNESKVFKELERLEKEAVILESEQKRLYPMLDMPLDNFIVAFVHPTYPMSYFVNTDYKLKLKCARVNSDLIYKNKNEIAINRPKLSSFKLQLNDIISDTLETIEYDIESKTLTITAPVQDQEIKKSIIYFNIFNCDSWKVPNYMKNLFDKMRLEPPVILPLGY